VLEKLRERQSAAHRKETQRQEVKQFDETAILGYVRRQEALR
jgi:flagellar biosynthesis chaperone FliJ